MHRCFMLKDILAKENTVAGITAKKTSDTNRMREFFI